MSKPTCLVTRYGGIGDSVMLTPILRELSKKFDVTFAVPSLNSEIKQPLPSQVNIFKGLDFLSNVIPIATLFNAQYINIDGDLMPLAMLREGEHFDRIIDYRNLLESNSPQTSIAFNRQDQTRNSNLINVLDLACSWAGIDPNKDFNKRPIVFVDQAKKEAYAKQLSKLKGKIIGIQTFASNISRRIKFPRGIGTSFFDIFPEDEYSLGIFFQQDSSWHFSSKTGEKEFAIRVESIEDTIALMCAFDGMICADTGLSHIAEALEIPNVTVYTTVPSWTRIKYHKFTIPVDSHCDRFEHGCFTLKPNCEIEEEQALINLSEDDKFILEGAKQGLSVVDIADEINVEANILPQRLEMIKHQLTTSAQKIPECIRDIKFEDLLKTLKSNIGGFND